MSESRPNRPRNVHVAVVPSPDGVHVWNSSFTLRGDLPPMDEARAKRVAKAIADILATIDFKEIA
jgi:hypothetical protein